MSRFGHVAGQHLLVCAPEAAVELANNAPSGEIWQYPGSSGARAKQANFVERAYG